MVRRKREEEEGVGEGEEVEAKFQWYEKRLKAVPLVASGEFSDSEVGKRVGVSGATIKYWRQFSEFSEAIEKLEVEVVKNARRYLGFHSLEAAVEVVRLMKEAGVKDAIKLRAAQDILDRVGIVGIVRAEVSGLKGGLMEVWRDISTEKLEVLIEKVERGVITEPMVVGLLGSGREGS